MSITAETAAAHKNDPAVVCCRTEAGTVLAPDNFEDPGIFPDLVDSGLLNLDGDVLTIGQALGAKLTKTIDSLTPVTADIAEGINNGDGEEEAEEAPMEMQAGAVSSVSATVCDGVFKLHIGEGKNIDLEIPVGGYNV